MNSVVETFIEKSLPGFWYEIKSYSYMESATPKYLNTPSTRFPQAAGLVPLLQLVISNINSRRLKLQNNVRVTMSVPLGSGREFWINWSSIQDLPFTYIIILVEV
ncbi:hypothetical protein [Trichormus variabilis]|uniref:hypothetical protein n=1 Tax=Anabaena variabilis TaxID=264691 RepID=UPI000F8F030C|nr:hypothetical protein [Trichormus variabilis]MBD2628565.1 hypothetical protein [Trichormus variabilis FACHB-164]